MNEAQTVTGARIAVVTGAASGIGAAVAIELARRGDRIAVADRDAEGLERTAAAIREIGGEVRLVETDVTDRAAAEKAAVGVAADWGRIDVLATCAGVGTRGGGTVLTLDEAEWHRIFDINVIGTVNWMKAALPAMIDQGKGAIVTVASQLALNSGGGTAAYIASKGAIISLTKTSAVDFAKDGVRINAVAPAVIDTPMSRTSRETSPDPAAMQAWRLSRHPIGRVGTPEEAASAICYLASDEASFITGAVLAVDGGWTAA
jgi:2-keto-3-deoxy-L-fuconate dehydrogenase